ncbi:nitrous oxide reductase accessory protein NosL [Paracoccus salsus]|uniref:nitrous oxide reductase accessory protein NosL n=1 Tax=Paracoccus salsus TaxID=2911061 RepID=UPI001F29AD99|nr:nitrous oxide reductase accessory protein NosL [Paracoccus salsus]MCF3973546.1 nitrous oxide reductase accessory protein NosL [Paracoccus salsus]
MKRFLLAILLLTACRQEAAQVPDAVTMTGDALGHVCMMQLDQHPGPKAQIHLSGMADPIFFAQVRDALAYVKGLERDADILAFYVSDMGAATSWDFPGIDNWTDAATAHFVTGAAVTGGMGAPEIVPFRDADAARSFAAGKAGEVMRLDAIPPETVLGPVDTVLEDPPT